MYLAHLRALLVTVGHKCHCKSYLVMRKVGCEYINGTVATCTAVLVCNFRLLV